MIRFMIVDDERLERILIKESFPWQEAGFELIGEAGDGEAGLFMYQQLKPELVITDINMPFMDGLAFAQQIKQLDSQTEIIVLTGFDEFDYAQLALNIGVDSFLLKPISRDDIKRAALRAKEKIHMRRKLDIDIKESFLLRLAYGRVADSDFESLSASNQLTQLYALHYCLYCLNGGPAGDCREAYRVYQEIATCHVVDLYGAVLYWIPETRFDSEAELIASIRNNAEQYQQHVGVSGIFNNASETALAFRRAQDSANHLKQKGLFGSISYEQMAKNISPADGDASVRYSRTVRNALATIDLHFCDSELSLRTLARDLFINDSYLSRIFKNETQKRISEYILEKRIEKACELLRTTDLKVYQIAEQVGIQDAHYFGQCFKKQMNLTVNEYRNQHFK